MNPSFIDGSRASVSALVLILLLSWESFAPYFEFFVHRTSDRVRHATRNLGLGLVNATLNASICVALWWTTANWAQSHDFGLLNWFTLPRWTSLIAAFLLIDLWMYAWHRLNHRIPFLWRFHRVHHSDPFMDVTTAHRFHIGEIAFSCLLRIPVIALTGVQIWELALYEIAMFTVVQLHHANITLSAPLDRALRLLFVTPFLHKVHHSRLQPETDSNYSSLFSFWDRLFRSFRLREDPHTIHFGLDEFTAPEHQTYTALLSMPARRVTPKTSLNDSR